jgi:hypothetical protein
MGKYLLFNILILLAASLPARCDWRNAWDAYCHVHESNYDEPGLWLTMEIRRSTPLSNPHHVADSHEEGEKPAFHVYIDHDAVAYNSQVGQYSYIVDANEIETVFVRGPFSHDHHLHARVSMAWWLNSPTSALQVTKTTRCVAPEGVPLKLTSMPTCCMKPPRWQDMREQTVGMRHKGASNDLNELRERHKGRGPLRDGCWRLVFAQSEDSEPVNYDQWRAGDQNDHPHDYDAQGNFADNEAWGHTLSILDEIESFRSPYDGKFTFAMSWSDLGSHDGLRGVNVWRQSSNPTMSPSVEGFERIDVRWTSLGFEGL